MLHDILGYLARRIASDFRKSRGRESRVSEAWIGVRIAEGLRFQRAGEIGDAEERYRSVLSRQSDQPDALHLLATIEHGRGKLDEAEELVRQALAVQPRAVEYLNTLGTILGDTARPEAAVQAFRGALEVSPSALRPRSNLLFLLNLLPGVSRETIFEEHLEWARIHADPLLPVRRSSPAESVSESGVPVRIGYISGDLWGGHPVGRIISTVIPLHDRGRFRVHCYNNTRTQDGLTDRLRTCVDSWLDVRDQSDETLAERIQEDKIDVLVDLSGHTRNNRLNVFARQPARVQVGWLGYLNTTGMRAMGWRLVSTDAELPGAEKFHAEKLWHLDGCPWPWVPPEVAEPLAGLRKECPHRGRVTFGSFNSFRKLNKVVLAAWADILRAVPGACLRIYGVPAGACIERTYDQFDGAGIEASRLSLFGASDYSRYLQSYGDVDISLDPFPYNGGATTCESLWMGVPVVTLAGSGGFGRTSASFLRQLGFEDLVCNSLEHYREAAIRLAGDPDNPHRKRQVLRDRVRAAMAGSHLQFVQGLEQSYLGMLDMSRSRYEATC